MGADSYVTGFQTQKLQDAFPELPAPVTPFGGRVLVQLRRLPTKSKGGIVLIEDTKETVKWNNQVAKLVALGPLAFKNRETAQFWPEGQWAKVGDYVRVPRWDGDRVEVLIKDSEPVVFVTFNDHQLIGRVNGDPLDQLIYEL